MYMGLDLYIYWGPQVYCMSKETLSVLHVKRDLKCTTWDWIYTCIHVNAKRCIHVNSQ